MRTLLTSHQFPPRYTFGTEKLTFECGRELLNRDHEVYVLTTQGVSSSLPQGKHWDYDYQGLKVRLFGMSVEETADPLYYEFDNPEMAEHMRAYMREIRPDVVHVWHAANLSGSIIRAAKEFGVPVVFTATDFWSLCRMIHLRRADTAELCTGPNRARTNCLRCYIARAKISQAAKDKHLNKSDLELAAYTTLANFPVVRNLRRGRPIRAVTERVDFLKKTINSTDRVITPTRFMRQMLLRNGIEPRLLTLSPYGIETSHITAAPPSPERPPVMRFGFMGGLVRHKGVHTLIKAFRGILQMMSAELKIYGDPRRDPTYFNELKQLAKGDRRIRFEGPCEGEKIGWVLSDVDVLAVPSAWYENTPLVIYEAFASGTPVVATDLGGLSEVIEHGKNGLLFKMDDAKDLNAQLLRFLSEPDLISKLRVGIDHPRTVADSVEELEGIYEELLGSRKPASRAR